MGAGAWYARGMAPFTRKIVGALATASLAACHQAAPPAKPAPAAYAQNRCGGASPAWQAQGEELRNSDREFYRVETDGHGYRWNGVAISEKTLRDYLAEAGALAMPPPLSVVFAPDTPCTTVAMVRRAIDTRMSCGSGSACAEYSEAEWKKADAARPHAY